MKRYLFAIIVISLLVVAPFFKKGFFKTDDGDWMVIRFSAFHQTLTDGQFPVRFTKRLNNNYGYPVLNFLYPAPFYFAELPKFLGFSYLNSIKSIFVLTTLLSSVFMFLALSVKFKPFASFIGALIYLISPYHVYDIYVRGSLGENMALMTAPLVLLSILKIANGSKLFLPVLSFSVALMLLSHNALSILFLIIFILICYALLKEKLFAALNHIILGILMSVFFTIPAILDLKYVKLSSIKISNVQDYLINLNSFSLDFNNPAINVQTILYAIPLLLGVLILRSKLNSFSKLLSFTLFSSLIITLSITGYFWTHVPGLDIIQFPWRILAITTFLSAILIAYLAEFKNTKLLLVSIIFLALLPTLAYIISIKYNDYPDTYYSTNESSTTVKDEYMPIWVKNFPKTRAESSIEENDYFVISNEQYNSNFYNAEITSNNETELTYNTIYFPGHQAKIDGKNAQINYLKDDGLIRISLPAGTHEVIIIYGKTLTHLISELISLVAILLTSFLLIKEWLNRNSS